MKLVKTFLFPNYPTKIKLSEKQRTKYYLFGKTKLLKKFLKKNIKEVKQNGEFSYYNQFNRKLNKDEILNFHYQWIPYKGDFRLVDSNANLMISNSTKAGLPKYKVINGQELHQLTILPVIKNKIVDFLKEYFITNIKNQEINKDKIKYPIFINYIFFLKELNSDINNHSLFYEKVFSDIIQNKMFISRGNSVHNKVGFIENDSIEFNAGFSILFEKLPEEHILDTCLMIKIFNKEETIYLTELNNKLLNTELGLH